MMIQHTAHVARVNARHDVAAWTITSATTTGIRRGTLC